nr:Ycf33 [Porphyropsis coccinea]
MPTFWENVIQLIRFFLSSLTGLLFIILSPFIAVKKEPFMFILVTTFSLVSLLTIYVVLKKMLGID